MAVLRRALSAVLVELRDELDSRRSYAFLSRAGSLDRQEPKRRTKSNACSRSKGSDPRAEKHVAAGPGLSCPTSLSSPAKKRTRQTDTSNAFRPSCLLCVFLSQFPYPLFCQERAWIKWHRHVNQSSHLTVS
jgi:hypothetical protein